MFALFYVLANSRALPTNGWPIIPTEIVEFIPPFTLIPRFALNLRRLYTHDSRRGLGSDIDTALGLTSVSGYGNVASAIMFADDGQDENSEHGEEIQIDENETLGIGSGA